MLRRSVFGIAFLLCAGNLSAAHAQTVRLDTYYYVQPATIRTDIRGHDVIVGKKPSGTKPDVPITKPYTVTMVAGANISFQSKTRPMQFLSAYNRANLAVTGGSAMLVALYDASSSVISGGTLQGVQVHDKAAVLMKSGTVGSITVEGSGTATITGGSATGQVYANHAGATVIVKGGMVASLGSAKGGQVNIISGYIKRADNEGTALILGGIVGFVSVAKSGHTVIRGGHIQAAHCYHTGTLDIQGGTIAYALGALESKVNLSQGNVDQFSGEYRSQIHLRGGSITRMIADGSCTFHLHGGTIRDTIFQQNDHATTHFYGRDLTFGNPTPGNGFKSPRKESTTRFFGPARMV